MKIIKKEPVKNRRAWDLSIENNPWFFANS